MIKFYKPLFIMLFLVGIVLNVLTVHTWDTSHIANDGVQYLSTAANWLQGNGFSTDALIYTPHFQGVFPAPQTVWPPGYPLAVGIAGLSGLELPVAALVLNLITHLLATITMYLVFRRMGIGRSSATILAFLFYVMAMPWSFVSGLITEPVFTTLILAVLLFLPIPQRSNLAMWILCGTVVAMCIYVRYSAVLYSASVSAGLSLYILIYVRPRFKDFVVLCGKIALLTVIPLLAFSHLMYRTHALIGTLDRYSGSRTPETLISTLRLWVVNSAELLGFSAGQFLSQKHYTTLFFVFTCLVLLITLLYLWFTVGNARNNQNNRTTDFVRVSTLVILCHGLFLFLYLSASSMSETPLEIVNRYLYQIYCGFYILFSYMVYQLIRQLPQIRSVITRASIIAPIGTVLVLYLLAQVNELSTSRVHFFNESKTAGAVMALPVSANETLSDYITDCSRSNPEDSVWSTHGQHLYLHTGARTVTHADIYTNRGFDPERLQDKIQQYNLGLFVFVEKIAESNRQYSDLMTDMKLWLSSERYNLLSLPANEVNGNTTVTVYIKPDSCSI